MCSTKTKQRCTNKRTFKNCDRPQLIMFRSYVTFKVTRKCQRALSSLPHRQPEKPGTPDEASLLSWLTTGSTPPPPITHRFNLTSKSSQVNLTTHAAAIQLTAPQVQAAASSLLNPTRSLLRSPDHLPPLSVEYSSPNIAKPLHMGHLRSTLTGSYVRNVAEYAGHDCSSICFLGDWGRQFGVLHAGVRAKLPESQTFDSFVTSLSLQELLQTYVSASAKADSDPEFMSRCLQLSAELEHTFGSESEGSRLWNHTRALTVEHLESCYATLGIRFDRFEGESTFKRDSRYTQEALNLLASLNLTTRHEDGSLRIKVRDQESVLLKRDDSSVYLLRDVACALNRKTRNPDHRFVYVVDQGQSHHFQTLFEILRKMGVSEKAESQTPFSSTHTHVQFGKVSGMSTRSGNFVLLSEVIDQGTRLMHESRKTSRNARNVEDRSVSEKLAVSGLIVNALKVRRTKTYAFDWTEALRSNGNSGVALQYTHARLGSLLRRVAGNETPHLGQLDEHINVLLGKPESLDLLVCLMNFEDTFWRSYTTLEPCTIVAYAFHLADKVSRALASTNVLKETDTSLVNSYLWLFHRSKLTLENCFRILGIPPVGEF